MTYAKSVLTALLALLAVTPVHGQDAPPAVSAEGLTDIPFHMPAPLPQDGPKAVVVYFSDAAGWQPADDRMVAALTAGGSMVLAVDYARHMQELAAEEGDCLPVDGAISDLAQTAERQVGLQTYLPPILAGRGAGAAFAYGAVAEAPVASFAAAVGSGFDGKTALPRPICRPDDLPEPGPMGFDPAVQRTAYLFPSEAVLSAVEEAASGQEEVTVEELDTDAPEAQVAAAVSDIADSVKPFGDLPAVDVPAAGGKPRALAIVVSGDGGWRDLDKSVADWLAQHEVHAVGLDALRYFWSQRTPEELARDLATIVAKADPTGKLPVGLIGYSFGADTLPFAWPLLPQALRDRTHLIGLLAPGPSTSFQVTVGGWLGLDSAGYDVPTAIAALPADKTICVSGDEEEDTACNDPRLAGFGKIQTTGGHHFDGDYDALAAKLMAKLLP